MNRVIQSPTALIRASLMAALFLVVVFVLWLVVRPVAAQTEDDASGTLITIHDRGEEVVVLTESDTIGGALEEAGVAVDRHDVVEPALTETIVASEYSVNIYRARAVTVIDGAVRTKVITAEQTPDLIVEAAGMQLEPEDDTLMTASTNVLDGGGVTVAIDRATAFQFDLFGTTSEARTQSETVGEMLSQKGITLGENDRVSPTNDTLVTDGMEVRVWREGTQTMTVKETVAFPVQKINDNDRLLGYREVQTPGVKGEKNVTYEVEIQNGVETKRIKIAEIVTKQPVKQVEVVGTKPQTLPYTGGGTKSDWLEASNIPAEHWGYADFMVQKESGWNPNAVNVSSGACGLAQALPCSKIPGQWNNPVNALNWMNNYVNGRYGGWAQAYSFWQVNRWY